MLSEIFIILSNQVVALFFMNLLFLGGAWFLFCQSRALLGARILVNDSIDNAAYGLVFFDDNGVLETANKLACKFIPFLCGKKSGSVSLKQFLGYMYDHAMDCDESLSNALYYSIGDDPAQSFREVVEWSDGCFCSVEAKKTESNRTVFVLNDISHLKENEEKFLLVNRSNHELSQAIEAATIGIIISDPKQEGHPVIFVNEAFCQFVGLPKNEIVGNDWGFVLDALDNYDASKPLLYALDDGVAADSEVMVVDPDTGDPRWFNVKLTPVNANEKLDLFIGGITEITKLKLQEKELFQGQKLDALGQLAAGVAHDFNNVLSIIDGYTRLAMKEIEGDVKAIGYLERVDVAAKRGANLTRRMLTFTNHRVVTDSVVDIAEIVKDQEILLRPLLDASIDFSIDVQVDNIFVECVSDSIGQILMNLVVNARDAVGDGGVLSVNVAMSERGMLPNVIPEDKRSVEYVCLSVEDNGSGMNDAVLARIFDPFFTTKDQGKGTGLGLSMVYGMVQEMGAFLNVVSSLGGGTKMQIYFPVTDKRPSRIVSGSAEDLDSLRLSGYTVLIVEDEPDLLLLVSDMLARLGMNIIQASNGNEALLKQEDYIGDIDLLLTDVVMPELNGVKLVELFHSLREETRVIFMSGYPANGEMSRVEIPESAVFMAKPVEYNELAKLVYWTLVSGEEKSSDFSAGGSRWETNSVNGGV